VADRKSTVGECIICTDKDVAGEIRAGAIKTGSEKPVQSADLIFSAMEILPPESPSDRHYGEQHHHMSHQGTPIAPDDLLTASLPLWRF
jgi:tRNA(fMet)-specific endonuclease VapC